MIFVTLKDNTNKSSFKMLHVRPSEKYFLQLQHTIILILFQYCVYSQ